MDKNLILLLFVLILSCEPQPSYEYNASNFFSSLRDYNNEVNIPNVVIHKDSTFSMRKNCYMLMQDNKVYLNQSGIRILLSKEEVKVLFEQIRYEYNKEKKMRPTKENEPDYNSQKHYYRSVYYG